MKKIKNNNGFTLAELILSIALFGIVAVSLIPIFTYGIIQINRSGARSEAVYENQTAIETAPSSVPLVVDNDVVTFTFDGVDVPITIDVYEAETSYDLNGNKSSIIFFKAQ